MCGCVCVHMCHVHVLTCMCVFAGEVLRGDRIVDTAYKVHICSTIFTCVCNVKHVQACKLKTQ